MGMILVLDSNYLIDKELFMSLISFTFILVICFSCSLSFHLSYQINWYKAFYNLNLLTSLMSVKPVAKYHFYALNW